MRWFTCYVTDDVKHGNPISINPDKVSMVDLQRQVLICEGIEYLIDGSEVERIREFIGEVVGE